MTQYKFRGKRKDNGEWVYGSLINNLFVDISEVPNTPVCYIIPDTTEGQKPPYYDCWQDVAEWIDDYEVKPETVGMWTGLKDKKGVDVFSGDIVDKGTGEIYWDTRHCQFRVRWHNEVFKRVRGALGEMLFANSEIVWEVIGNTTDNPELVNPAARTA